MHNKKIHQATPNPGSFENKITKNLALLSLFFFGVVIATDPQAAPNDGQGDPAQAQDGGQDPMPQNNNNPPQNNNNNPPASGSAQDYTGQVNDIITQLNSAVQSFANQSSDSLMGQINNLITSIENKFKRVSDDISDLNQKQQALSRAVMQTQDSLSGKGTIQTLIKNMQTLLNNISAQNSAIMSENVKNRKYRDTIGFEIGRLTQEALDLQKNSNDLLTKLAAEESKKASLVNFNNQQTARRDALLADNNALNAKKDQYTKQMQDLMEQTRDLQSTLTQLNTDNKAQVAGNNQLNKANIDLLKANNIAEDNMLKLKQKINSQKSEERQLNLQRIELEAKKRSLESAASNVNLILQDLEQALATDIPKQENYNENIKSSKKAIANLDETLKALRKDKEEMEKKLAKGNESIQNAQIQFAALNAEMARKNAELQGLQSETQALRENIKLPEETSLTLSEQIAKLKAMIAGLDQSLITAKQDKKTAETMIGNKNKDVKDLAAQVDRLSKNLDSLQKSVDAEINSKVRNTKENSAKIVERQSKLLQESQKIQSKAKSLGTILQQQRQVDTDSLEQTNIRQEKKVKQLNADLNAEKDQLDPRASE